MSDDNQIYVHFVSGCIVDDHNMIVYHLHVHKLNIYLVSYNYGKCSKIFKTSCMPMRPIQTGQNQIRLLLKK